MSLGKKAVLAVLWNSFGNYIGSAINFFSQLILVRLLLPEDFGIFALAVSIIEIIPFLTSWSFSIAIIQMPEQKDLINTAFWLSLIEAIILFVVSLGIFLFLQIHYPNKIELSLVFLFIAFSRGINLLSAVYAACMEKDLHYKNLSLLRSIINIVSVVAAVSSAIFGFGVWSLVVKELVTSVLCLVSFKYISKWKFEWRFSINIAKSLLHFNTKMLFSRGLEVIHFKIDSFLVGILSGTNILGYYAQARYLADVTNAISAPGTVVAALPVYSKIQNDEKKLKEAIRLSNFFLIRFMLPFSLLFLIFPYEVVKLLLGEKWERVGLPLQWLALYPLLVPVFENLKTLLYGIGKVGTVAYIRLTQILIAIILIVLGIKFYGLAGAVIGFIISMIVGVLMIYIATSRYSFYSLKSNIFIPLISVLISIFSAYLIKIFFSEVHGLRNIFLMTLSVLIYFFGLYLFERKTLIVNLQIIYNYLKPDRKNS